MVDERTRTDGEPRQTAPEAEDVAGKSDRRLLDEFDRGCEEAAERAFGMLVRRHGPMVLRVCRHLLGDEHAAEDAFQATFLVLARRGAAIRRPELLGHWLYGVAVRTSRKAGATRRRRDRHEKQEISMSRVEPIGKSEDYELRTIRREEAEVLHEELGRLPEKYRVPLVLCSLEGMTHDEAADRLGWPVGTLSVRLMRARALLRARLTRRGLAPTAVVLAALISNESPVPPALARSTVRAALRVAAACRPSAGVVASGLVTPGASLPGMLAVWMISLAGLIALGLVAPPDGIAAGRLGAGPSGERRRPAVPVMRARFAAPEEPSREPGASGIDSRPSDAPGPGPTASGRDNPEAGATSTAPTASREDLEEYQARMARVGRDPEAQFGLALWCEAHRLEPEAIKHLARAVLADPDHAAARGLLGQVAHRGRWERPEAVGEYTRPGSADRAEYRARRGRMANTPGAHWRLALWCEQHGLESEALAHLTAVTRLDPGRDAAWQHLGYKKANGRWMRPEEVVAERERGEARRQEDRHWRPLLTKWNGTVRELPPDDVRRRRAEARLDELTDPGAVPSIWSVLARGGPADQALATRLLGQIDGPSASRALALLAVSGDSAEVRRVATETLSRRDPRDVVGLLIGLLVRPVKYEVRPVEGPGSPGILFVEGDRADFRRFYTVPQLPGRALLRLIDPTTPADWVLNLASSMGIEAALLVTGGATPGDVWRNLRLAQWNRSAAAQATRVAQQQLNNDILRIEANNRLVSDANRRVASILAAVTGQGFGQDEAVWRAWWTDQQGVSYDPPAPVSRPILNVEIPLPYRPDYRVRLDCFGAGTPVWTDEGPRRIESIGIGDLVLTQDTSRGTLSYQPVLAVLRKEPSPTLQLTLGGETIATTGIHRFWKPGQGWVMARDLKPGDPVRLLGGLTHVDAVADGPIEPVFNLEVASNPSYFVGQRGILGHDNTLVQPERHPFDVVAPRPVARGGEGTRPPRRL
jgi:RNA polymerase sigma factor (sigma-70 family)